LRSKKYDIPRVVWGKYLEPKQKEIFKRAKEELRDTPQ